MESEKNLFFFCSDAFPIFFFFCFFGLFFCVFFVCRHASYSYSYLYLYSLWFSRYFIHRKKLTFSSFRRVISDSARFFVKIDNGELFYFLLFPCVYLTNKCSRCVSFFLYYRLLPLGDLVNKIDICIYIHVDPSLNPYQEYIEK